MLGVPPALANTKFPVASSDVIGREPPDARAKKGKVEQGGGKISSKQQCKMCLKARVSAFAFL